mgnify:CR=1 FL=1
MALPKDPVMLLSFVNTQLRDNYSGLKELAAAYDIDEKELCDKLAQIDSISLSRFSAYILKVMEG